jgi:nucleotide-binding universal stress UspA family protein
MKWTDSPASVLVGIDGSASSVHAAEWAVPEAISRDVPLRLIHVIQSTAADVHLEMDAAEAALREAQVVVAESGQPVKTETAILRGPVAATLAAESRSAAMVCVGSTGLGLQANKYIGATAAAVARSAPGKVAIIRTPVHALKPSAGDVAVVVDDSPRLPSVLQVALDEARLRGAGLLVLNLTAARLRELAPEDVDRRLAEFMQGCPDIQSHVLMARNDIPALLAQRDTAVQLVVGDATGDAANHLVGPYGRFVLRDTECSVLLVGARG